jgi:Protein of unknown function (DUF551)
MEWISIKDQLPDTSNEVFVYKYYLNQEYGEDGYFGEYFSTPAFLTIDSFFRYGWSGGGVVTHWMPLPKPPEG